MSRYVNYLNNQTVYTFKEKGVFSKLSDAFIKDVTLKRNTEWNFLSNSAFQHFVDHSPMKAFLSEIREIMLNNKDLFDDIVKDLDPKIRFILFQPISVVFNSIMSDSHLYDLLINKVETDFNKKSHDREEKDYYNEIFKENIKDFVEYFQNGEL